MENDRTPDPRPGDPTPTERPSTPSPPSEPDREAPTVDPLVPQPTADDVAWQVGPPGGGVPGGGDGGDGGDRDAEDRDVDAAAATRRRRLRRYVAFPLGVAAMAALVGVVVAASINRPQVETLDDFVPRLITRLHDRHGQVIQTYSRENRVLLEEGDLPEVLKNAILAVEDANFYEHGGIDLQGIVRAAITNIRQGEITEGASTITMQLARELFALTRERDFKRKFEEALLAVELEKRFSKQQILTLYSNMVNLSQGNYGMEAAARNYFNKSVGELTLAEAATLAGIPQRPTYHNPYARPDAVRQRRDVVLLRMRDEGFITDEEYEGAVAEPLLVVKRRREDDVGPYFSEEVRRHLIETYGETELYDRGLQVQTTLDRDVQRAAEAALRQELLALDHEKGWRGAEDHLEGDDLEERTLPSWAGLEELIPGEWYQGLVLASDRKRAVVRIAGDSYELTSEGIEWTRRRQPSSILKRGDVAWFRLEAPAADGEEGEPVLRLEQEPEMEAAAVVLESATGAVRALVGGWDYDRNEFNRVTQAQRQVGSAFKPFVFGAALEIGFTPADTLFDGPVVFPTGPDQPPYSPRNFYRRYEGIMTLRHALEKSINVPAVKLMDLVGVERVIDFTHRCGITGELPPYPSLALGVADITPIELAAAYATFANLGVHVEPYLIEEVTSRSGRTMEEHLPRASKAMDPTIAYLLTDLLRGVALRGTGAGKLARLEIATAGKTGTTNNFTDAWFVGFTPRYTLLTWVGYDKKRFLGRGMTGAHAALPIWDGIVRRGLEDGWLSPGEIFEVPPGIIEREVESRSGLLASRLAESTQMESFVEGTEPEKRYDREWARVMELPWYLQEPFYIPKEGERMPGQVEDWGPVVERWQEKNER